MSNQGNSSIRREIIAGIFLVIAACITGVFLLLNTLLQQGFIVTAPGFKVGNPQSQEQSTSIPTSIPTSVPIQSPSLIINGAAYQMPINSAPYCVAQEVHTQGENIVNYDVVVPNGWVMMWDSWKAQWDGGSYDNNGLLIIRGPYSGKITINTGGSCSGPVEWYSFIHENRMNDFSVPSRPEYNIP